MYKSQMLLPEPVEVEGFFWHRIVAIANKSIFAWVVEIATWRAKRLQNTLHVILHGICRSVKSDKKQPNTVFSLFYVAETLICDDEELNLNCQHHLMCTYALNYNRHWIVSLFICNYIIYIRPFGLIFISAKLYPKRKCQFSNRAKKLQAKENKELAHVFRPMGVAIKIL